jgi:hypothetical protein
MPLLKSQVANQPVHPRSLLQVGLALRHLLCRRLTPILSDRLTMNVKLRQYCASMGGCSLGTLRTDQGRSSAMHRNPEVQASGTSSEGREFGSKLRCATSQRVWAVASICILATHAILCGVSSRGRLQQPFAQTTSLLQVFHSDQILANYTLLK